MIRLYQIRLYLDLNPRGKPMGSQSVNAVESIQMSPIYQVQARRKGRTDDAAWFDMEEILPLPSDQVRRCVSALNGSVPDFVYRAVLVAGGDDVPVPPVVVDDLVVRIVALTVAEIAMLRMWLPLQIECLDAAVADSKRWEIWRAQADAARSLLQKIS